MYKTIDLLNSLVNYTKKYRLGCEESVLRNKHMNGLDGNEKIEQKVVDAILVDFINFIGANHSVDYVLYTNDLEEDETLNKGGIRTRKAKKGYVR